jgi:hypothetical protein
MVNTKRNYLKKIKCVYAKLTVFGLFSGIRKHYAKSESLVIVGKKTTVKRYLSFAQTARHTLGIS